MIVDDEASILQSLKIMLSNDGHTVHTASSGKEALEVLQSLKFGINILITDVIMPQMNGYILAKNVLNETPELPIIFISGFNSNRELNELINTHDHITYLQKPFGIEEIKAKITELQ
ncbi:MAG: response regulator [Candidatus Kariarchaeaceae archaeon]|jgi:two-component system cell cycle sensor histidine kinase/response regulator CckA